MCGAYTVRGKKGARWSIRECTGTRWSEEKYLANADSQAVSIQVESDASALANVHSFISVFGDARRATRSCHSRCSTAGSRFVQKNLAQLNGINVRYLSCGVVQL